MKLKHEIYFGDLLFGPRRCVGRNFGIKSISRVFKLIIRPKTCNHAVNGATATTLETIKPMVKRKQSALWMLCRLHTPTESVPKTWFMYLVHLIATRVAISFSFENRIS